LDQFVEKVRNFEIRLQNDMENIFCPTHLSLGHERVAAQLHECIRPEDWVYTYHRNHGHYLAKGGSEQKLWDEIHGLKSGVNGGFSGSQGFSDESLHFHSSAIVGGLVGVATGTAYALKMDSKFNDNIEDLHIGNPVVVCIVGDAGTEAGVFWESLNFAALNRLPIAYICENNGKSVDARITERQATPLGPRVSAFGVDVRTSLQAAVASARYNRPAFYEAMVRLECDHLNMSSLLPKWS
jgi:pyruvate dehydrogenase E1 component alpha subunit